MAEIVQQEAPVPQAAPKKTKKDFVKSVAAGTIGNILEWFDYGLYGYFAAILATNFFVAEDPMVALILSFMTFGMGFLVRPIGGIIIGIWSDKHGRMKAITFCVVCMGVCTFLMGCLPTYDQVGILAPILLVVLRMIQGLLTGGAFGSSLTFLSEFGEHFGKAFITSFQPFSVGVGLLMGSFTGLLMSSILTEADLYAWGWRIPFLIGILISLYAWWLNRSVDDSPEFLKMQAELAERGEEAAEQPKIGLLFKKHWIAILTVVLMLCGASTTYYLLITYMPTYISQFLDTSFNSAFVINTGAIIIYLIFCPLTGLAIDKLGPRRGAIIATVGYLVVCYPVFSVLVNDVTSVVTAIAVIGFLCIFQSLLAVANCVISTEIFPTELRNSGVGFAYNLAVAIFGGMAPAAATALIAGTGNVLAITWLIFFSIGITCLTAVFLLKHFYNGARLKPEYASE